VAKANSLLKSTRPAQLTEPKRNLLPVLAPLAIQDKASEPHFIPLVPFPTALPVTIILRAKKAFLA
jgi:hypothetical protein